MDIEKKIYKILDKWTMPDGKAKHLSELHTILCDLIRQEVSEAMPKEKDIKMNSFEGTQNKDNAIIYGMLCGYNQALSEIQSALQKKGLI